MKVGFNESNDRILHARYFDNNPISDFFMTLFAELANALNNIGLLKGQTNELPPLARTKAMETTEHRATFWNIKKQVWAAHIRTQVKKEALRNLIFNFLELKGLKIDHAEQALIMASNTTEADQKTCVVKIGFNKQGEKLLHVQYSENLEFLEDHPFFTDLKTVLESNNFLRGQEGEPQNVERTSSSTSIDNNNNGNNKLSTNSDNQLTMQESVIMKEFHEEHKDVLDELDQIVTAQKYERQGDDLLPQSTDTSQSIGDTAS